MAGFQLRRKCWKGSGAHCLRVFRARRHTSSTRLRRGRADTYQRGARVSGSSRSWGIVRARMFVIDRGEVPGGCTNLAACRRLPEGMVYYAARPRLSRDIVSSHAPDGPFLGPQFVRTSNVMTGRVGAGQLDLEGGCSAALSADRRAVHRTKILRVGEICRRVDRRYALTT